MLDFTINIYYQLLKTLQKKYQFITVREYFNVPPDNEKFVILRHDVDKKPKNSLKFAEIEFELGIKSTYYFRTKPCSYIPDIIVKIRNLGHEIGYHYENMDTCKGNTKCSIKDFEHNLGKLRNLAPIDTVCMHGSPLSKWDNKDLWKKYNYKDFDILGEPYLDIDFNKVYYLTDTGRRWNGARFAIRDRVININPDFKMIQIKSTQHIIHDIIANNLPNKIMLTLHPQRWTNNPYSWLLEISLQSIKNIFKLLINLNSSIK